MRGDGGGADEEFAAYVRERGDHHLRVAVLLTGDWHAAKGLVQASLVKLYRVWPRLDTGTDPDAYLRRIMVIRSVPGGGRGGGGKCRRRSCLRA